MNRVARKRLPWSIKSNMRKKKNLWERKIQINRVFRFQSQHVFHFSTPWFPSNCKTSKELGTASCWKRHTGQGGSIFQLLYCKFKLIKASLKYISLFFSRPLSWVSISKNRLLIHLQSQDAFLFYHVWVCGRKKCRGLHSHWEQHLSSSSRPLEQKEILNYLLWPQVT